MLHESTKLKDCLKLDLKPNTNELKTDLFLNKISLRLNIEELMMYIIPNNKITINIITPMIIGFSEGKTYKYFSKTNKVTQEINPIQIININKYKNAFPKALK